MIEFSKRKGNFIFNSNYYMVSVWQIKDPIQRSLFSLEFGENGYTHQFMKDFYYLIDQEKEVLTLAKIYELFFIACNESSMPENIQTDIERQICKLI